MFIIAVVNQKGGVGKTTTAMSIADVYAENSRVLLADIDPQQSATWWADQAGDALAFDVVTETDPTNLSRMQELPYDIIIVDTPGSLEGGDVLDAVVSRADFVLLPSEPAPLAVMPLITSIQQLVLPHGVDYRVLINRADPRLPADVADAHALLERSGIKHFRGYIRTYKAHAMAPMNGRTVTQYPTAGTGANAISDYTRIERELQAIRVNYTENTNVTAIAGGN